VNGAPITVRDPRARVLLVTVVVLAAIGLLVVVTQDGPDHLARARAELAADDAFARSSTAGEALLRASTELQRAGTDCDGERPRCDRLLTAAAMARVSSVQLLDCRRPDIFAFRARFRLYLDALAAGDDPTPPPPPACD
jgi:hypothetical protein